ncbi:MAG: aspartate aminotransferase family protein [Gammaproteobacteria bacterium]|nr:aspartate aminotransferase family protein [Gammaproteobacteria bacterium]
MPDQYLMPTYANPLVDFERGEGPWLYDSAGRQYLDALSGIAVCNLGHAHPAVTAALAEQAATLVHTSNLFGIPAQRELAKQLVAVSGMEQAFFCNSGAEANECALKIARAWGHQQGVDQPAVVVMERSFHGRTLATLSATGNRKVQAGFEPLVPGFRRAPFGDLQAVEAVARNESDVVAVLVEPVLGEGGVVIPQPGYLAGLRRICDEQGWLLMLDEIQTGMCRSGRWFAHEYEGIRPDVMSVAKALGNGVPIGACLARGPAADVLGAGSHGSTFGGNPLACRAALAVLEVMQNQQLAARAEQLGERIAGGLSAALADHPRVSEVRHLGMLIGIQMDRPAAALVELALAEGLVINVTAGSVVRLLPPLILSDDEADELVARLVRAAAAFATD